MIADRVGTFYTRAIRDYAHGRLLDLGCGKAPFLGYYAEFVDSATLVDWGNSLHDNPLLDLVADLNKPLEFGDETYDTIILSDVLEHIQEPKNLMSEISRILDNGGVLLLNVPFLYPIHEEPFDYYRYTRFSLERMCEGVGLEVIEISPIAGLPEILIDIMSKSALLAFGRLPSLRSRLAALIQLTGAWLMKLRPFIYASRRSAQRYPLGYALIAVKKDTGIPPRRVTSQCL
jgi:SAM-dependent methyltransferase